MAYKNKLIFIIMAAFLMLVGCRATPVMNVENSPIEATGKYSLTDVKKAILTAGRGLGWRMKEVKSGTIVGTLFLRQHMAKVNITYNKKTYSIKYKDSSNLKYDGATIHKNYNSWVQNLDNRIQAELSAL